MTKQSLRAVKARAERQAIAIRTLQDSLVDLIDEVKAQRAMIGVIIETLHSTKKA